MTTSESFLNPLIPLPRTQRRYFPHRKSEQSCESHHHSSEVLKTKYRLSRYSWFPSKTANEIHHTYQATHQILKFALNPNLESAHTVRQFVLALALKSTP